MARTPVTVTVLKDLLVTPAPAASALTQTKQAADIVNFNSAPCTGKEMLIARNTHATLAKTVTINSVPDAFGRSQDVTTYSLAVGEELAVPIPMAGYRQPDGNFYFAGTDVLIIFSVLQRPY